MEKLYRKLIFIFAITLGLPFILLMAFGYYTYSEHTFWESFKNIINDFK